MFESLLIVAGQVGILFALMAVGFVCNKAKLLDEKSVKGVVRLLVLIVTPCLVIHVFQRPFERRLLSGLGWAFGMAVLTHVLAIAASFLIRTRDARRRSVLRFAVIFSNAGFMGIPLEQALLGNDGVFFGVVYVVVFNVFCWSYGLIVMCGSLKDLRLRTLCVNPGTMGVALGLPLFFCSVHLPPVIHEPIRMISDLNTPLAMIVIGYYLAESVFRPVLTCGAAYLAGFLRLVALPFVTLGVLWLLPPPDPLAAVALVTAASAPVAALTTMLGAVYGRDLPVSVGLVSGTTLLSILTMPPVVGLAMWLFGVRH